MSPLLVGIVITWTGAALLATIFHLGRFQRWRENAAAVREARPVDEKALLYAANVLELTEIGQALKMGILALLGILVLFQLLPIWRGWLLLLLPIVSIATSLVNLDFERRQRKTDG